MTIRRSQEQSGIILCICIFIGAIVAVLSVACPANAQTPTPTPSKFCLANDGSSCVPWYGGTCVDGHLVSVCPTPGTGTPVPTHTPTPAPTSSQQYCHNGTACAPLGALGCPGGTINSVPCTGTTPTPTQTPSVTATPTATPFPQPILTDLPRLPVTWTYAQNFCPLQLPDGSVIEAGNAGHVAGDDPFVMPSYGTELPGVTQECIYAVNYASSPPQLAVLRCSGWTVDEWERGGFRITTTGTAGLEGVTIYTRRPASGDYYHAVHAAAIDRWRLDSWPGQHAELLPGFRGG